MTHRLEARPALGRDPNGFVLEESRKGVTHTFDDAPLSG